MGRDDCVRVELLQQCLQGLHQQRNCIGMQVNFGLVEDDQRPFLEVSQCSRNEVGQDGLPGAHGGRQALLKLLDVLDRKSTRLNSSHLVISYAVFCLKKKTTQLSRLAHCLSLTPVSPTTSHPL